MTFYEDMDFSIWDCRYSQDESCYLANSWPYDFYANPRLDIIEEDALNEQSCIQVLKLLIAKADTEILAIEQDIVMLQSELALADEQWRAICFTSLRQSINSLDRSIQDLKNANVNDELHLGIQQMHPKPVESIHELLRALLQDYYSQSDEQNKVSLAAHSSDAQKGASTLPKGKILNSSTSNIDSGISTTAKKTLNSLSSGPGTTASEGVKGKVAKDSAAEPLRDEACSNLTKSNIRTGLEDFREDEVGELGNTDKSIVLSTTEKAKGINCSKTTKAAGGILGSRVVRIKQEAEDSGMNQRYGVVTAQRFKEEITSQLLETEMVSIGSRCSGVRGLSGTDHGVEESSLVVFNQKIKVEPQENSSPKTQVVALAAHNSNLSLKLRSQELMEIEWPLFAKLGREPCLAEELGIKSLPTRKLKKQVKSEPDLGNKNSDETRLALVLAKNADSTPQMKRKKINHEFPVMKENENLRDFQMRLAKSQGGFKNVEATGMPSSSSSCVLGGSGKLAEDLERMNKIELRTLARQHSVKGWYALKKAQLIHILYLCLHSAS